MSADLVPVALRPNPFRALDRLEVSFPVGITVEELLRQLDVLNRPELDLRVMVGDQIVPPDAWATRTLSDARELVAINSIPNPPLVPVLLTIGAALAAAATTTATTLGLGGLVSLGVTAGGVIGGAVGLGTFGAWAGAIIVGAGINYAVGMVANLAINAFVKPQSSGNLGGGGGSPRNSPTLTGAQNQAYLYGPVWRVFGEYWVTFPLAAKTFTETIGGDQYLRMLLTGGYGPLDFDTFRIGETALSDFDSVELEYYDGLDYWRHDVTTGTRTSIPELTLFRDDVETEVPSVQFDLPAPDNGAVEPSEWAVRSTSTATEEISVDLSFSSLYRIANGDGQKYALNVEFDVEIKPFGADDTAYVAAEFSDLGLYASVATVTTGGFPLPSVETVIPGRLEFRARREGSFITGFKIKPAAPGQFTLRIRRFRTGHRGEGPRIANVTWSALRSIRALDLPSMPNVTLLALRIKATDQLSGSVNQFRAKAYARLRPYLGIGAPGADVDGWGPYQRTSNPAWVWMQVLTGQEAQKPMPLGRIDLARIMAWAAYCEPTPGEYTHRFDAVIDWSGTLHSVLQLICGVARASYANRDGKHSVVIDVPKPTPVQLFTPRNSWGYRGRRRFIDYPHALRVNFPNEQVENQTDEILSYAPSYDAGNATEFETLELIGVTGATYAWQEGQYHQKVARARAEQHEITVDVEYLVAERGDRVLVSHDVPTKNTRVGRITLAAAGGGIRPFIEIDETIETVGGTAYSIQIRWLKAGVVTISTIPLQLPGDQGVGEVRETNHLVFGAPQLDDADHAWEVGDLVTVGESAEYTIDALVHQVTPGADLTATLLFTAYAPEIFDDEVPPEHVSMLSAALVPNPPIPEILDVLTIGENLVVSFKVAASVDGRAAAARIQAQYRTAPLPAGPWTDVPSVLPTDGQVVIPLETGEIYDVRLRAVSNSLTFSTWSYRYANAHTGTGYTAQDYAITGFEVKGRADSTEWSGRDLELAWRLSVRGVVSSVPPAGFAGYRVVVTDAAGIVRRRETISDPRYNYSLARNQEDTFRLSNGTSSFGIRTVLVSISAFDSTGAECSPLTRVLENAAPQIPTLVPSATAFGFYANWSAVPDPDSTDLLIWRGSDSSFDPDVANRIITTRENPAFVDTRGTTDRWYKYALADEFSDDPEQLNVSTAVEIEPGELLDEDDITVGAVSDYRYYPTDGAPSDFDLHVADWPAYSGGISDIDLFTDFSVLIPANVRIRIGVTMQAYFGASAYGSGDHEDAYEFALYAKPTDSGSYVSIYGSRAFLVRQEAGGATERRATFISGARLYPPTPLLVATSYDFMLKVFRRGSGGAGAGPSPEIQFNNVLVEFLALKK